MIFDLQKASISKRISAFLFDIILLGALVVGIAFLLSGILNYDDYQSTLNTAYANYEAEYGVSFEQTGESFMQMTPQQQENYNAAYSALINDKEAMSAYNMVLNLTLVITSLSILFGYLILEFAVPLCFKNGQTLGKKIFGIGVMHKSGIQITPVLLFFRTILGKYTLETMVPVLILMMIFFNVIGRLGTIILGLFLLLQIIIVIVTPGRCLFHDLLAQTVAVDISSQKIFKDGAELLAYKQKLHAEEVARQSY